MERKILNVNKEIILKEICQEDVLPIFDTINAEREYIGEWLPFVDYTLEMADTLNFIESLSVNETKDLTFAIYYKEKFAGLVGLKDPDYDNKKVEIGFWISEKYQHLGIISLSCKALINHAFKELGFNRIQLKAAVENINSQKVAQRLGFIKEGIEREGELHKRGFVDLMVFGLLKRDFLG